MDMEKKDDAAKTPAPQSGSGTAEERALQRRALRSARRRRRLSLAMMVLGAVGLALATLMIARHLRSYGAARAEYQALREGFVSRAAPLGDAGEGEGAATSALSDAPSNVDVAALKKLNPDCVGWVELGDIAYPVVQAADNDYYLTHTFEGAVNGAGAIFVDWRCDPAFGDASTLVYGHNMRDGSMFSGLGDYQDAELLAAAPPLYIHTEDGVLFYRLLLAATVPSDDALYGLSAAQVAALLDGQGVEYPEGAAFLTLSTCTDAGGTQERNVVVAVRVGQAE